MTKPSTALFACALLLFPFAFDNFELPKQLVLSLGCIAFAARPNVPWSAPDVRLVLGWLLVALFAAAFSASPWLSVAGVEGSRGGWLSLCLFAGWYFFARGSNDSVAGAACAVAWPIAAWAWLQQSGHDPVPWSSEASWCGAVRPFSSLGHPAHLGVFCALVIPLALEEAWANRRRGFAVATALVAASACVISLSRAGWLAAAAGVGVWSLLRPARRWVLAATLAGAGALALWRPEALMLRLRDALAAPTRLAMWKTALRAFEAHPLTGVGLDGFQLASQQFRPVEAWQYEWGTTPQHAHALVAQVLATMGVPGAVMLLLSALVVWRAVKSRSGEAAEASEAAQRARRDEPATRADEGAAENHPAAFGRPLTRPPATLSQGRGLVPVVIAGIVAWMVTFHSAAVLALWLACSAELARQVWPAPALRSKASPVGALVAALFVIAFPLRWCVASAFARYERFDVSARLEPENALWQAQLGAQHERAHQLSAARDAYALAVRKAPFVAVYLADVARIAAAQNDLAASELFARALALDPLDAHLLHQAAIAANALGHPADARTLLERLLVLYPSYGPAWSMLAELDLAEHRGPEARAMLQASLQADWRDWPRGRDVAQSRLAQVLAVQGELEQAVEVYRMPPPPTENEACGAPKKIMIR